MSRQHGLRSDIRRKKKTLWDSTEVQGKGRRYWFPSKRKAIAFAKEKRGAGYLVDDYYAKRRPWEQGTGSGDGSTGASIWVSFAKCKNVDRKTRAAYKYGIEYDSASRYF